MSVSQTCPNCRVNFFGPTHNVNSNLCDDCVESELLQHPAVAAAVADAEQRGREQEREAVVRFLDAKAQGDFTVLGGMGDAGQALECASSEIEDGDHHPTPTPEDSQP